MLIHIKRCFFQKLNAVLSAVDLSFNVLIILTAQIKLRLLLPANILHLTFPCNFNRHCYLRLKKRFVKPPLLLAQKAGNIKYNCTFLAFGVKELSDPLPRFRLIQSSNDVYLIQEFTWFIKNLSRSSL